MEKVGDIIWDTTKYLCSCAKQEVDFITSLEENLQSLRDKWDNVEAMKNDVEAQIKTDEETGEMQRSEQVSVWIKRIQDIQEEVKDIQIEGAQEVQNKCLRKCCPKNCKSSYKLGKKVAKMLPVVDDLTTKGVRFGKDDQITHKLPHKPIDQIPLDETVGQDSAFNEVWNSIEANKVRIIGIYGTGGVGKTTLLKKINNELGKRRPDFFVIWVVVSKERNMDRIMDNIRKSVGIEDSIWSYCNNEVEKASKICGVLKQKKFVLLLDDVWERLDLSLLGVPHPKDTDFESKVLFTTRSKHVCAQMQAQTFKVEFLNEREAWELFRMKVGAETLTSHPRINVLAKEMASKCKGLPLALIVIGGAMAGVESVEAWEGSTKRLTSSLWTTSDLEKSVFSILKLSYDQLPSDVHRRCFLYCALYPEDYEIEVTDIIDKWIWEGLLCNDMTRSIQDIRNDGHSVIAKLKLCCLLESVEDDFVMRRSFKMHDVIRDMALWLACDEEQRTKKVIVQEDEITTSHYEVETWNVVERISFMDRGRETSVPPITYPNLVTLLVRCRKIKGLENIKYMSKLKVLELNAYNLYNVGGIGGLHLLEYLTLRIEATEFPKELKNLKNLKVFNLSLAQGASIPLGVISSLQHLRVFRVVCSSRIRSGMAEQEFLEEVESLPKIEELNVGIYTKNGLDKLLNSNKLQSSMCALRLSIRDTFTEMSSLLARISEMKCLHQFLMSGLSRVKDSCIYDTCCLTMLQSVAIINCHSLTHVTWLKYAPFLQVLIIAGGKSMEEVIKEDATAKEGENVDSSSTTLFSSLVNLHLILMPKLQSIHKAALSFPSLKTIRILFCPKLKKLPLHSNPAKHKLTLIKGEQEWWNSLEWDDLTIKHHFQSKFQSSAMWDTFNLPVTHVCAAAGLTSWC